MPATESHRMPEELGHLGAAAMIGYWNFMHAMPARPISGVVRPPEDSPGGASLVPG